MENLSAKKDETTEAIEKQTKKFLPMRFCSQQSAQWLYHLL